MSGLIADRPTPWWSVLIATIVVSTVSAPRAQGRDEQPADGWTNVADIGLVMLAGNSSTRAIHLDDKLTGRWGDWLLDIRGGGLRSTERADRFALGTSQNFTIVAPSARDVDSARYYARGDAKHSLTSFAFWTAGVTWDRDTGAGIEHRTSVYTGPGTTWWDREGARLASDYSLSYTERQDEVVDPERTYNFVGSRLSVSWLQAFGADASFLNESIYWMSFQDTRDRNFDIKNTVTSHLNDLFALRIGLEFIYHNFPALEDVDLFDDLPNSGGEKIGTVRTRTRRLDTILKATFVITIS